jgi:hypothetical protein
MKRGGGPKTREGKARAAQNSRSHGLNVPIASSGELSLMRDQIARSIAGEGASSSIVSAALDVATAEVELIRIRREKERVICKKAGSPQTFSEESKPKITRKLATIREKIELLECREGMLTHKEKILSRLKSEYQRLNSDIFTSPAPAERGGLVEKLRKIERYEQRALSRRRKAIRRFAEVVEN